MFGKKELVEALNSKINNGTLDLNELIEAFGSIESFENNFGVRSVDSLDSLPDFGANKGTFVYIKNEHRYEFSNGNEWNISKILRPSPVNLLSWGQNVSGILGNNSSDIIVQSQPNPIAGGFADWVQTSASGEHNLGLRANGTIWAWGRNFFGGLGDNTTIIRSSPVSVVGGFTDWIQVSAGGNNFPNGHSLGVRANGTMWSWGRNNYGQLGDDTLTQRNSPVSVVGGFADWISASAGNIHNLGVRANGSLWAWGSNTNGRLGDDSTTNRSSPVSVVGGFTDWNQVSAGYFHSLGVRANGTLWAWGRNTNGRLGDDSITDRSSPVSVVGGFTDWISASAGGSHSLGVRANGSLWAWGSNSFGRLGDDTLTQRNSPVSVVGGFTDWISASAGDSHSLGVRTNGTLWAWGGNYGKLGDNTITSRRSPVSVVGGFTDWIQASAGTNHSLGIRG